MTEMDGMVVPFNIFFECDEVFDVFMFVVVNDGAIKCVCEV